MILLAMILTLQIQILGLFGHLLGRITGKLIKGLYILVSLFFIVSLSPLVMIQWYAGLVDRPLWYPAWNSYTALIYAIFAVIMDNTISFYVLSKMRLHIKEERSKKQKRDSILTGIQSQDDHYRKTRRFLFLSMASDWIAILLLVMRMIVSDPVLSDFFNELSTLFFTPHGLFLFAFYHNLTFLTFKNRLHSHSVSDKSTIGPIKKLKDLDKFDLDHFTGSQTLPVNAKNTLIADS